MGFEKLVGLMRHAYDRGIRFFDLADLYGTSSYALAGEYQMTGPHSSNLDYTSEPHFGYNERFREGDAINSQIFRDPTYQRTNRAIFTKLQYLFRSGGAAE